MYEDDLTTGTDYQYNSNLESMVVAKKKSQIQEKVNLDLVSTLLDENRSYSDLSQEDLIRLKKEHEDLFDSLPQKDLPIEKQSDLERAIREDYQEICEVLKNRRLI
ncbi:hypothetical protein [Halarcobacter ebronensis]|uniref:Uncharacterized protein n=1 Tax=Halarcobacter ebronensis TaxID=1462615 RepID=A0A4Q1AN80_9BACT|nr:hypothetical protein [Halarcobacter ebronensis]QKF82404.1 hypothetical protein AEBR_1924 [Halarcobacter ebronensis]RXK07573.1 hypothetical protein CRV07_03680 [Halarcobacter ebronensis]